MSERVSQQGRGVNIACVVNTRCTWIQGVYADSTVVRIAPDYWYLTGDVRSTEASNKSKEVAKTSLIVF